MHATTSNLQSVLPGLRVGTNFSAIRQTHAMSFLPIPDPKNKIIKVTAFAYKRPDVSLEAFLKHWRETHVEKFTRNPKVASKLLGYVQVRVDYPRALR